MEPSSLPETPQPSNDKSARAMPAGLAGELRPMLTLAGPVVLAELGWMAMGVVDTMFVGGLGAEAIGAVGLGNILVFSVAIFGFGLLMGLDPLVSQAFGAGRIEECHRCLRDGVHLGLLVTIPLMVGVVALQQSVGWLGLEPGVERGALAYSTVVNWSLLPLYLYVAFRRYLQAMNLTGPIVFALISANILNILVDWVLIYGQLGFPALGVVGAAWATVLSRTWMALVLVGAIFRHDWRHQTGLWLISLWPEVRRLRRLFALGFPAAVQFLLEVGVFAVATAMIGSMGAVSLAAHQIALNVASVTFMVPLGISSAGAVRVGQALGRKDPPAARRAGWLALGLGVAFMAFAALVFLVLPRTIVSAFTADVPVVSLGATLLWVAAVFQMSDGLQVVATGILRGAGDTRTPMVCNLIGHWGIGLPIGSGLGFAAGLGVVGLWIGLSAGLVAVGAALLYFWTRTTRAWASPVSESRSWAMGAFSSL